MTSPAGATPSAPQNAFYIAAANLATQLATVIPMAREIGLGAANTMALTARAELAARSFRPIARFMQELADTTIRLTHSIGAEALKVSRGSIAEMRTSIAIEKVEMGLARAKDASFRQSALPALRSLRDDRAALQTSLTGRVRALLALLDEIDQQMLAAISLSKTARKEAAGLTVNHAPFELVALNLGASADEIRKTIVHCRAQLRRRTAS